jgi:Tol biopolymer transport system component
MKIFLSCFFVWILSLLAACSPGLPQPTSLAIDTIAPTPVEIIATEEIGIEPSPEIIQSVIEYGLEGRLVLIEYNQMGNRLLELDLVSGRLTTIYQAPGNSWLSAAVVSPDNQQIVMAYAPPLPEDEIQYGYTDLYLLPYSGSSQPQLFLDSEVRDESYYLPTWDSDGQAIYYTRLRRIDPNSEIPTYQNNVEVTTINGETRTIVENALWPILSPNESRFSYLSANPFMYSNDLYLANLDGTNQMPVFTPGAYPPIDAHIFSKDGNQLIFSMVNAQPAPASSWLEDLFGVITVSAHNVPSDWYTAPITGGNPQRLTELNEVNLIGDLSPDGSQMAFIGASGLYVMNIDGSGMVKLSDRLLIGTVDWIQ